MSTTDKSKNELQKATGKVKEKTGEFTGNKDLQARGKSEQTRGDLKQAGEKVKDVFKH